jgi:hypothetical protein
MSNPHKTAPSQDETNALRVIIAIVFVVLTLVVLPWQPL